MTKPRAVAIILDDDQRILVIKRFVRHVGAQACPICHRFGAESTVCPGHHYAVLPGGGVEDGETAEQAVLRELAEETTLTATIDRLLWTGPHYDRPASYFLMTDVTGTPVLAGEEAAGNGPDNSFELVWAGADDLAALGLVPDDVHAPVRSLMASNRTASRSGSSS
jgi:8-oxo-dGTP pyrophosphatase MutT (NUDIX family)